MMVCAAFVRVCASLENVEYVVRFAPEWITRSNASSLLDNIGDLVVLCPYHFMHHDSCPT